MLSCVHYTLYILLWLPTTNSGMQNGSLVGTNTCCTHAFACLVPICMRSRCLLIKFLRRSSVESFFKSVLLVGLTLQSGDQLVCMRTTTEKKGTIFFFFSLSFLFFYASDGASNLPRLNAGRMFATGRPRMCSKHSSHLICHDAESFLN